MQIFKHHHVTRSKFGAHPKGRFFFFFLGRFFVVVCRDISYNIFFVFCMLSFFETFHSFKGCFFRRNATCSLLSLKSRPCGRCFFEMCLWARASVLRRRVVIFFLGGSEWGGLCKGPAIAIAGRVHQKSRDSHGSKMDTVQLGMQQGLGLLAGPIHQSSRYQKHQHIGWLYGCCIYWKPAFHHLKHVLFIHFQYFNKRPSSWSAIWSVVSRYLLGHVGESCRANPEADSRGEPKTGAGLSKCRKWPTKISINFGKPNQPKKNQMNIGNHRKP